MRIWDKVGRATRSSRTHPERGAAPLSEFNLAAEHSSLTDLQFKSSLLLAPLLRVGERANERERLGTLGGSADRAHAASNAELACDEAMGLSWKPAKEESAMIITMIIIIIVLVLGER